MRTIYMGTPEFAVPALDALIESKHEVVVVVTQPDRIKGRGKKMLPPPVKETAVNAGIPVMQPDKIKGNNDFLNELKEINPDIIVVAAYGRILPKEVLELPKFGCINIHASLLPIWRGAAPMQHAILAGDEKSGVTIMQMAEGLDTGDMLSKAEVPLTVEHGGKEYGIYHPTLSDKLSKLGAELLLKTLDDLETGVITPEKQDESQATYASMINKEDGRISFEKNTPAEIERMIRAFEPWPGAFASLNGEQIKFKAGEVLADDGISGKNDLNSKNDISDIEEKVRKTLGKSLSEVDFGTVLIADNSGIYIKAKDGVFKLTELQIPGKNWMDAGSYLRGHKLNPGTVF